MRLDGHCSTFLLVDRYYHSKHMYRLLEVIFLLNFIKHRLGCCFVVVIFSMSRVPATSPRNARRALLVCTRRCLPALVNIASPVTYKSKGIPPTECYESVHSESNVHIQRRRLYFRVLRERKFTCQLFFLRVPTHTLSHFSGAAPNSNKGTNQPKSQKKEDKAVAQTWHDPLCSKSSCRNHHSRPHSNRRNKRKDLITMWIARWPCSPMPHIRRRAP